MARLIRLSEDGDLGKAGDQVWVDDDHPDNADGPRLITLTEDGPLGSAGTQVWVDDPTDVAKKPAAKKAAAKPDESGSE